MTLVSARRLPQAFLHARDTPPKNTKSLPTRSARPFKTSAFFHTVCSILQGWRCLKCVTRYSATAVHRREEGNIRRENMAIRSEQLASSYLEKLHIQNFVSEMDEDICGVVTYAATAGGSPVRVCERINGDMLQHSCVPLLQHRLPCCFPLLRRAYSHAANYGLRSNA